MRGYHFQALALAFIGLPMCANSTPITYDFAAKGTYTDTVGSPTVPAELGAATQWDIKGSIIVDNEIAAVYDDPYVRLGQQIVGGSLSVNGLSAGDFDAASFRYYFFDGFEESPLPYDASFTLKFGGGNNFGPSSLSFYTEDLDWGGGGSGPNIEGIALDDAGAFLGRVKPSDYAETQISLGAGSDRWNLYFDQTTSFEPRDESTQVPEPASTALLALGLAGMFCFRRRLNV